MIHPTPPKWLQTLLVTFGMSLEYYFGLLTDAVFGRNTPEDDKEAEVSLDDLLEVMN